MLETYHGERFCGTFASYITKLLSMWNNPMSHFFGVKMQMDVLSNKDPLKSVSVIDQFTMRFNDYDISECRMVHFRIIHDHI
jgi:hypothetical protein